MENNSSMFIRRFLLFVAYTNISATSAFYVQGMKDDRRSPVRERGGSAGISAASRGQLDLPDETVIGRRPPVIVLSDVRVLSLSSVPVVKAKFTVEEPVKSLQQNDREDVDEEEQGKKERQRLGYDSSERRIYRTTRQGRRRHSSRDCWKQLDLDIDLCLLDFERLLGNAALKRKQRLNESFRIEFCRSYDEMMACLHLSFVNCPPGSAHLNKVNIRIGHLRTDMQQLCDEELKENLENEGRSTPTTSPSSLPVTNESTSVRNSTGSTAFSRYTTLSTASTATSYVADVSIEPSSSKGSLDDTNNLTSSIASTEPSAPLMLTVSASDTSVLSLSLATTSSPNVADSDKSDSEAATPGSTTRNNCLVDCQLRGVEEMNAQPITDQTQSSSVDRGTLPHSLSTTSADVISSSLQTDRRITERTPPTGMGTNPASRNTDSDLLSSRMSNTTRTDSLATETTHGKSTEYASLHCEPGVTCSGRGLNSARYPIVQCLIVSVTLLLLLVRG